MSGATFRREISLAFGRGTLWEDVARKTAAYAREDRDRRVAAGEFPRTHDTFVGGREGAAEETIRPGEVITYRARSLGLAAAWALDQFRERSPDRVVPQSPRHNTPVRFRDSFFVAVRERGGWGGAVRAATFAPARLGADAEEVAIFSNLPFARKVNVQLVGQKPIRFNIPAGLFGDVAAALRRRYPMLESAHLYTLPPAIRFPLGVQRDSFGRRIHYPCVIIALRR